MKSGNSLTRIQKFQSSEQELLDSAWESYEGLGSFLLLDAKTLGYIQQEDFDWVLYESSSAQYAELKFMLACFILLEAGEEI